MVFGTDVVSYLPFVLLAVLAFRPGFDRADLATRGLAAAAAVAAFMTAASPILAAYQSADNVAHVAMLGLTDSSRDSLRLREAPYSYGSLYDDGYLATVIAAYSERLDTPGSQLMLGTPGYTKWSNEYYRRLLTTFPGDMLVRAWAAVIGVFQLPFHPGYARRPLFIDSSWDLVFRFRWTVLSWFDHLSPLVAACILAVVAGVVSWRLFGVLVLFGIVVPGLTAIQFHPRHVFHLEVLPLLTYGCLLHAAWVLARDREMLRPAAIRAAALQAAVIAFAVAVLVVVPVTAARAYQERNVTKLLSSYESAELERIDSAAAPQPDGRVLLAVPLDASEHPGHFVDTNVLSITVGGDQCDTDSVPLTLRYRSVAPFSDFTRQTMMPAPAAGQAPSRLLFPVYTLGARSASRESQRFVGVEVAAADEPCIQSLARFKDPDRISAGARVAVAAGMAAAAAIRNAA